MGSVYFVLQVVGIFFFKSALHAPFGACAQEPVLEKQNVSQKIDPLMHIAEDDLFGV